MVTTGEVRRVSEQILGRIVTGAYSAGVRLPSEIDLAEELGCGRSTVREALRHLADLGVVRSRRGSGATVLDFRREGTPALLPAYLLAGRFDRPVGTLAREMLRIRSLLAGEAVRLAARYATDMSEARRFLARAPALEGDLVAHAVNEVELFRAIVGASGIWPAVWLANVFWAPVRELHARLAPFTDGVPEGYQRQMETLLSLIEKRDEEAALRHLARFFDRVDAALIRKLEPLLASEGAPASAAPPSRRRKSVAERAEPARGRRARPPATSRKASRKAGVR